MYSGYFVYGDRVLFTAETEAGGGTRGYNTSVTTGGVKASLDQAFLAVIIFAVYTVCIDKNGKQAFCCACSCCCACCSCCCASCYACFCSCLLQVGISTIVSTCTTVTVSNCGYRIVLYHNPPCLLRTVPLQANT